MTEVISVPYVTYLHKLVNISQVINMKYVDNRHHHKYLNIMLNLVDPKKSVIVFDYDTAYQLTLVKDCLRVVKLGKKYDEIRKYNYNMMQSKNKFDTFTCVMLSPI